MANLDLETLARPEPAFARSDWSQPRSLDVLSIARGERRPDLLRDELLAEIFSAAVARSPGQICIIAGETKLTYREVDDLACGLARGLLHQGLRPGDVVGIWMPRGAELLVAQIAAAKIGAAWLPMDADAPLDRVAACLADAGAKALLCDAPAAQKAHGVAPCPALTADAIVDARDAAEVDARALGARPDHPAYIIYTSGSTGAPKGIVIANRNICHFLRSANLVYGLQASDVVFQSASAAFDLSMEEIWTSYLVGATLFVATPSVLSDVDRLPDAMEAANVTVLDTVPTLLGLLPRAPETLRLVILGGEACPSALLDRWRRPGRRLLNSYGPTEATVVATVAELRANAPVTIGRPIANYTCFVCDENLNLVERGVEGELLIGGPGVACGYLNRPELTREKFIQNPFDDSNACDDLGGALYRSGDAVVMDEDGQIFFRGRIDDQVKIRGFRVELGEIEARLTDCAGVAQAAVVVRADSGVDELVAFVVCEKGFAVLPHALRAQLRAFLPAYMTPTRFESIGKLPRLPSGKVDRNKLKQVALKSADAVIETHDAPRTDFEARLLAAAQRVLPPQPIGMTADFFLDLGGHSLLAARFLGVVREHPDMASLTLQDVYGARSLRGMADLLEGRRGAGEAIRSDLSFTPPPLRRRFLCGLAQAVALPFIISLMTAQWLGVFIAYSLYAQTGAGLLAQLGALLVVFIAIDLATVAIAIAAKWLILGRAKPGRYPMWGVYYFRWWLVQRIEALTEMKLFQGSPVMRPFLAVFGCKVGRDAMVGDIDAGALDLVEIGAGASIGSNVKFDNARVEGAEFVIGRIIVGEDAHIGGSCVIQDGAIIGKGAELRDLTSISSGERVGEYEVWDGSPGRKVDRVDPASLPTPSRASRRLRAAQYFLYCISLIIIPPIGILPILPAFWIFDRLDALSRRGASDAAHLAAIPVLAWPSAVLLIGLTVAFITVLRWIVLPRLREGRYSIHSWLYFRKWFVALATEVTLESVTSLTATIYMRAWYRLLGARIGRDAEISTNVAGRYDLIDIGAQCFIADEVMLGEEEIRRGWMHLKKVRTGQRVFLGNSSVAPAGVAIPDGVLIGIKSKPPSNEEMSPGDTWFGSPPIKLPLRQRFDSGDPAWTYTPPAWKKIMRAGFEAVNISLPTMLFITLGSYAVEAFGGPLLEGRYGEVALLFTVASVAISLILAAIVIALKWISIGRYAPTVKPMWSFWAMRTEAIAVLYAGLAGKVLFEHLRGTPFLPWVLRLFGARFGQGVWLDSFDFTEFDCVRVGDFVSMNTMSALQTHLYEDRMMKIGQVVVGDGVTIGANATVLYDAKVGDFARIGPLTVVMKGEGIPAHSDWIGLPATPRFAGSRAAAERAA